jgi:ADP-ribose pyrophosphatase YjhB (NUDIX family)
VFDRQQQVLLTKRAECGTWALIGGILEPGEQPAMGIQREILEETGVEAEVEALVSVDSLPPTTYANGDHAQYLDLCFRATSVGGLACVNDDESLEVGWFAQTDLPSTLSTRDRRLIAQASEGIPVPVFVTTPPEGHR